MRCGASDLQCATCGTQVSSEAEVRPHLIFIRPKVRRRATQILPAFHRPRAYLNESLPEFPRQAPPVA